MSKKPEKKKKFDGGDGGCRMKLKRGRSVADQGQLTNNARHAERAGPLERKRRLKEAEKSIRRSYSKINWWGCIAQGEKRSGLVSEKTGRKEYTV